ncbi:ABC transporter substrate-binding protein [Cutibacterium modestum]|uniref:ABC transporter substrate-binding protein n=1 Tax=Cutibacterium modestum TaxID=2559073 RepID=UPI000F05F224|nr:ABC transporter substrate-binding protein [Cutibacterium modestum]
MSDGKDEQAQGEQVKTSSAKTQEKGSSRRRVAIAAAVVVICAVVTGIMVWRGDNADGTRPPEPYKGPRVELSLGKVPSHVRIGLVVSYTENPREGSGWIGNAHGAQVAIWRLAQGGDDIEIQVVSDKGSGQGAKDAVAQLKEAGVTGIVAATSGPHTKVLAEEASRADIPILLPYATRPDDAPEGAWFGVPTATRQDDLIEAQAAKFGCRRFATRGAGLRAADTTDIPVDNKGQVTKQFVEKLAKDPKTCVYLENLGPVAASDSPTMVSDLRAGGVTAPIFLGLDATSAASTVALVRNGAIPNGIYSLGVPSDGVEAVSLAGNEESRAFSEAVTHLTTSKEKSVIDPSRSFETYSGEADGRSHDAVVTLIAGSVKANSNHAEDVRTALSSLNMSKLPLVNRPDAMGKMTIETGDQIVQLANVQGVPAWVPATK